MAKADQQRSEIIAEAEKVISGIRPLMRGRGPDVQGAVLAELVALYIGGHEEELRPEIRRLLFGTIDQLTPVMADAIWRGYEEALRSQQ